MNTNNRQNRSNGYVSIPALLGYCKRFSKGLANETHGPQVLEGLPSAFPTDYASAIDQLTKVVGDHATAKGAVHVLTRAQDDSLEDITLLSGAARQAAKAALTGQDALLRSEFQVGASTPRKLRDYVARGLKLVAACKKHAEVLASQGWSAARTTALETAVTALDAATTEQDTASDAREGVTAQQADLGNMLYRMCRTIQCVAKVEYSLKKAKIDPTVMEARGLFLLDEFPPKSPSATDDTSTGSTPTGSGTSSGGTQPAGGSPAPSTGAPATS